MCRYSSRAPSSKRTAEAFSWIAPSHCSSAITQNSGATHFAVILCLTFATTDLRMTFGDRYALLCCSRAGDLTSNCYQMPTAIRVMSPRGKSMDKGFRAVLEGSAYRHWGLRGAWGRREVLGSACLAWWGAQELHHKPSGCRPCS